MKTIPLSRGAVAIVDDADFETLSAHKWHITSGGYAARNRYGTREERKRPGNLILMHREIIGAPPNGYDVDHIDGDPLNNTRINLRIITRSDNIFNSKPLWKNNSTGVKGVCRESRRGKFIAYINKCGRRHNLGYFDDVGAAAAVRAKAEELLFRKVMDRIAA